ncbi:prepilin-type N-terminal cleavage/methylation domain-containing protein [Candidatus Aerophobetes bacterium]|nr:prepilin-type N-terminal cleavage/methylation domain-containing protein [Candidatus Aerophobetes bacterium]
MKNKRSGFTLIELMVAMMIAAIGILAISWILVLNQTSWREADARLKLQRDAYYALLKIEHLLREASSAGKPRISILDKGSALKIGQGKFFIDEDNNLIFQVGESNPELVIEGDSGTKFNVSRDEEVVKITLNLARGKLKDVITTSVMPRN